MVCMPITQAHALRLGLRPLVEHHRSRHGTNFTTSIEAAEGIATGISAHDRALTIKVAASESARPEDIVQPGHVFPLVAQAGGVLVRAGHTEACCDLAQLAPHAGRGVRSCATTSARWRAGPGRVRCRPRPQDRHHRRLTVPQPNESW
jgi:3,4-dihydroxy 2-butanone 4-phosphate synthase/GTP cyclohydrolase II